MTDYWNREILVLGCGNILFGDDGFGPAVVEYLQRHYDIPPDACVMDAGLGVRDMLLTIALSEKRPRMIVIVDAIDEGRPPGEVCERRISDIPQREIGDHSMHLHPTSSLLRELSDTCGVDVEIISVQVQHIPDEVSPGLSGVVRDSIPVACEKILEALH